MELRLLHVAQKRGKYKLQPVPYLRRDGLTTEDVLRSFVLPTFLLYSQSCFIISIINTALRLVTGMQKDAAFITKIHTKKDVCSQK